MGDNYLTVTGNDLSKLVATWSLYTKVKELADLKSLEVFYGLVVFCFFFKKTILILTTILKLKQLTCPILHLTRDPISKWNDYKNNNEGHICATIVFYFIFDIGIFSPVMGPVLTWQNIS